MDETLSVALGQALSRPGDLSRNLDLARRWAEECAGKGTRVLCLPELFDWGYDLRALAERGAQPESLGFSAIAAETGVTILAGVAVEESGTRNAFVKFTPDGKRESYAKIHLFEAEPNPENKVFQRGHKRTQWRVENRLAAPMVCYDLRFPELARAATLDGADVLFVAAAWPAARREVFRVLTQARAIENQLFVVSVNLCGESTAGKFAGHSLAVAPDGSILAEAEDQEGLFFATLDFSLTKKVRAFLPCFEQRRPDLY